MALLLVTGLLGETAAAAALRVRLQGVAGHLPPQPPVPCPLAENTWAAFLVKQLDPSGTPVSITFRPGYSLGQNDSNCFYETDTFHVAEGTVRIVATDGEIVRTCDVTLTEPSSKGHMNVIIHVAGTCSANFVKAGG